MTRRWVISSRRTRSSLNLAMRWITIAMRTCASTRSNTPTPAGTVQDHHFVKVIPSVLRASFLHKSLKERLLVLYSIRQIIGIFHTILQVRAHASMFGLMPIQVNLLVTLKSLCIQQFNCFRTILSLEAVSINLEIVTIIFMFPDKKTARFISPIPLCVLVLTVFMHQALRAKLCSNPIPLEAMMPWAA